MGVVFGIICTLCIGVSDTLARRAMRSGALPLTTANTMQIVAIATSFGAVGAFGGTFTWRDFILGLVSGLGLGLGLFLYFAGMDRSSATVVSPMVAVLSAVVPYGYAVLRGSSPTAKTIAGAIIAVAGLLLVTVGGEVINLRQGLLWGTVSGLAYGTGFAIALELSDDAGAWPAAWQRVAAATLLTLIAVRQSVVLLPPRSALLPAFAAGVLAGVTTIAYLVGVRIDAPSTVVAASMFPAATVALSHFSFGDAVSRRQVVGIALSLFGIAVIALGSA